MALLRYCCFCLLTVPLLSTHIWDRLFEHGLFGFSEIVSISDLEQAVSIVKARFESSSMISSYRVSKDQLASTEEDALKDVSLLDSLVGDIFRVFGTVQTMYVTLHYWKWRVAAVLPVIWDLKTRVTSDKGLSRLSESATAKLSMTDVSRDLSRVSNVLRLEAATTAARLYDAFHSNGAFIEDLEVFAESERLRSQEEDLLQRITSPRRTDDDAPMYRELVATRNQLSVLLGFPNYGIYIRRDSALMQFERSRGRWPEEPSAQLNPVSRLLTAIASAVKPHLPGESWYVTEEEIQASLQPTPAGSFITLRQTFDGIAIVLKALLNVELIVDHEQDLWNETMFALRVMKGGIVMGLIFVDVRPIFTQPVMVPLQCRVRASGAQDAATMSSSSLDSSSPLSEDERVGRVLIGMPGSRYLDDSFLDQTSSGEEFFMDRATVTQTIVEVVFHEMSHAIHCLLGEVSFDQLTMPRGPTDFIELPSHVFELLARDWFDFVKGKSVSDRRSQIAAYSIVKTKLFIQGAILDYCRYTTDGEEKCELWQWLGRNSQAPMDPTIPSSMFPRWMLGGKLYSYVLMHVIAPMIYSRGGYREKAWNLFSEHASHEAATNTAIFVEPRASAEPSIGSPLASDAEPLAPDAERQAPYTQPLAPDAEPVTPDAHATPTHSTQEVLVNRVTIRDTSCISVLPGEQAMQSFFASGSSCTSFDGFFAIVPELAARLKDANHLEEALDMSYFIEEMLLASKAA